jgi:hypothetical protein
MTCSINNNLNLKEDGLQDFNSTTGDFSGTELTTKGDLLGYTGSGYERFAVGTDDTVLKADSSQSVGWRWACAPIEFISTATASGVTSVEFNDFADSECYSGYKLIWKEVNFTSNATTLALKYSIDNGSSFLGADYQYGIESIRTATSDTVYPFSSSASFIQLNKITNPQTCNCMGETLFKPRISATGAPNCTVTESILQTNTIGNLTSRGTSMHPTTSEVDAFQFLLSSGETFSGIFTLYGILKE